MKQPGLWYQGGKIPPSGDEGSLRPGAAGRARWSKTHSARSPPQCDVLEDAVVLPSLPYQQPGAEEQA